MWTVLPEQGPRVTRVWPLPSPGSVDWKGFCDTCRHRRKGSLGSTVLAVCTCQLCFYAVWDLSRCGCTHAALCTKFCRRTARTFDLQRWQLSVHDSLSFNEYLVALEVSVWGAPISGLHIKCMTLLQYCNRDAM